MIAEIAKGDSIKNVIEYNEKKIADGHGEIIYDSTFSLSKEERIRTLEMVVSQNPSVTTNKVFHTPISFNHDDPFLTNEKLQAIAEEYLLNMGYENTPVIIYRHFDTKHQHIHIVCPTVDYQAKKIKDFDDYRRSMELTRKLEKTYELEETTYVYNEQQNLSSINQESFSLYNSIKSIELDHLVKLEEKIPNIRNIISAPVRNNRIKSTLSSKEFSFLNTYLVSNHLMKYSKKQLLIKKLDSCLIKSHDLKSYQKQLEKEGIKWRRIGKNKLNFIYGSEDNSLWIKERHLPYRFHGNIIKNGLSKGKYDYFGNKELSIIKTNVKRVLQYSLSQMDFENKLNQHNIKLTYTKEGETVYSLNNSSYTYQFYGHEIDSRFSKQALNDFFLNPTALQLTKRIEMLRTPYAQRSFISLPNEIKLTESLKQADIKNQKAYLKRIIPRALNRVFSYDQFKNELTSLGIEVIEAKNSKGVYGLSFRSNGVANPETFKASSIGKEFSYSNITKLLAEKHLNIPIQIESYSPVNITSPYKSNINTVPAKKILRGTKSVLFNIEQGQNQAEYKRLKQKGREEEQ